MKDHYTEIAVDQWDQLLGLDVVTTDAALFRGHASAQWELCSSFVRECSRISVNEDYWISKEYYLLKEFRRRAHLHYSSLPSDDDIIGWLALMQHHGTPTRLVDFTYSFYVACFFAVSAGKGDCAIWCVDDVWARAGGTLLAHTIGRGDDLREHQLSAQNTFANQFLSKAFTTHKGGSPGAEKLQAGVLMLEPERQIQRLGVQQGLFLMPLNIHSSFISNLAENGEKIEGQENDWFKAPKNHFKKIVIADRVRSKALNELTKMNITAESLFPGLDGFARSLVQTILSA